MKSFQLGFTIVELLVVIAIINLIFTITISISRDSKEKANLSVAFSELKYVGNSADLYWLDYGAYPEDVDRALPPGLENYLIPGDWPVGPFPNSVYDWDSWSPDDLAYPPFEQVYQVSLRFCETASSPIEECTFPGELNIDGSWDEKSSVYFCIEGPCRSHSGKPFNHPGYCINCASQN